MPLAIEVKPEAQKKQFTGPTVELTPELLKKMRTHCEKQREQNGQCYGLLCAECPGSMQYNDDVPCSENGWTTDAARKSTSQIAKANCEKFLAEHPAQPKKRLERWVEEGE
jgi:hypothetical protein